MYKPVPNILNSRFGITCKFGVKLTTENRGGNKDGRERGPGVWQSRAVVGGGGWEIDRGGCGDSLWAQLLESHLL